MKNNIEVLKQEVTDLEEEINRLKEEILDKKVVLDELLELFEN